MKLTNKLNLPKPILDAILRDSYEPGDCNISITGLLQPPRIAGLIQLHGNDIEEDVSDRIWSLVGQSIHEILRRASTTGIVEKRLYADLEGWRISGQFDRIEYFAEDGLLSDYKITSVFNVKGNKAHDEWVKQLNCYCWLAHQNGFEIRHLEIVAILRDYRKGEARHDPEYPEHQVKIIPIELWPLEKTEEFLRERIKLYKQARETGELPVCTDEERWRTKSKWAVMRKGGKRAIKLYDFKEMAALHASKEINAYVEHRPGKYNRCEGYCPVSGVCSTWQDYIKGLINVGNR